MRYNNKILNREIGIDILKIISTLCIIVLHILNHGHLINNQAVLNNYFLNIINALAFSSVNCFALISGYNCYNKKINFSKIIKIIGNVLFYSILGLLITYIVNKHVFFDYWEKTLKAILLGHYWYIEAYIKLFFFIPLLNLLIKKTNKKFSLYFFGIILIMTCYFFVSNKSFSFLHSGYSCWWLIILYIIGAFIKKYNINNIIPKRRILVLIISLFIFMCSIMIINIRYFYYFYKNLVSYISPFIFIYSTLIVCYFSKITINDKYQKLIIKMANSSLNIYIIHTFPIIWYLLKNSFYRFSNYNIIFVLLILFGTSIIIYILCFVIDSVKQLFLRKIKKIIKN